MRIFIHINEVQNTLYIYKQKTRRGNEEYI
jgi:hypothetical protein